MVSNESPEIKTNFFTGRATKSALELQVASLEEQLAKAKGELAEALKDDEDDRRTILGLRGRLLLEEDVNTLEEVAADALAEASNSDEVRISATLDARPIIGRWATRLATAYATNENLDSDTEEWDEAYSEADRAIDREALHRQMQLDGRYAANRRRLERENDEKLEAELFAIQEEQLQEKFADPNYHEQKVREILAKIMKSRRYKQMVADITARYQPQWERDAAHLAEAEAETAVAARRPEAVELARRAWLNSQEGQAVLAREFQAHFAGRTVPPRRIEYDWNGTQERPTPVLSDQEVYDRYLSEFEDEDQGINSYNIPAGYTVTIVLGNPSYNEFVDDEYFYEEDRRITLISQGNGAFAVSEDERLDDRFHGVQEVFNPTKKIKVGNIQKKRGRRSVRLDPFIKADQPLGYDSGRGPKTDYETVIEVFVNGVGARSNRADYGNQEYYG